MVKMFNNDEYHIVVESRCRVDCGVNRAAFWFSLSTSRRNEVAASLHTLKLLPAHILSRRDIDLFMSPSPLGSLKWRLSHDATTLLR